MLPAPSAAIVSASNCVIDSGTSVSIPLTARPFTCMTSTPGGGPAGTSSSTTGAVALGATTVVGSSAIADALASSAVPGTVPGTVTDLAGESVKVGAASCAPAAPTKQIKMSVTAVTSARPDITLAATNGVACKSEVR